MKYNKENPLRVFTAFAGYDSQCLALERLKKIHPDFDYTLVGWSEFDPESNAPIDKQPAVIAHKALFPDSADKNYGDICKIDWSKVPDFDLFTYSFPCTDVSQAGKMLGLEKDSGTRSSLLWVCAKAIEEKKPKYLLMENVKNLVSNRFRGYFLDWQLYLEKQGYYSSGEILNSKSYGVPQNRERIFLVSIRIDDEDPLPRYTFPKPFPLEKHLIDVLEDEVDEKYFISDKMLSYFRRQHED
jgi:DNA (cytosine-5)-methyltransferase 1